MKPSEVPAKLKAWRKARGLSQGQAAPVLGISRRTLENWEQGEHKPSPLALKHLELLLSSQNVRVSDPASTSNDSQRSL